MINKLLVIMISLGLLVLSTSEVRAATLALETKKSSYQIGENISVSVYLVSLEQALNAISATITYPKELLEFVDMSVSAMENGLWLEQSRPKQDGLVPLKWLALTTGYQGKGARIVTLNFRTKASGRVLIGVKDLQILANDGKGTALKSVASGALITIEKMKAQTKAPVKIVNSGSVKGVKEVVDLPLPIIYDSKIDSQSPRLQVSLEQSETSRLPIVVYSAEDDGAGVAYYEISLDNGPVQSLKKSGALMLSRLARGRHQIRVVTYDAAGNQAGESKVFDYQP